MSLYADAVLADNPIEYWPMGEGDPAGTGLDLTLAGVGAVSSGEGPLVSGDVGATSFDGVNDSGQVDLDLSALEWVTVEFWLRWDAFANDDDLAMEFTTDFNSHNGGWLVDPNAETGKFAVGTAITGEKRTTMEYTRPSAGDWHHYVIAMNNKDESPVDRIKVYMDGAEMPGGTLFHQATLLPGPFGNSTLFLMCRNAAALFGAGDMAHLALFDTLLSEEQAAAHYAASQEEEVEEPEEPEEETDPDAFDDARLGWVTEDGFQINKGALNS